MWFSSAILKNLKNWKKSWSIIRDFPIFFKKTSIIKVILTFFDIFQKKQFYGENIKNVDFWSFFAKNQLFQKKMWFSSAILKKPEKLKKSLINYYRFSNFPKKIHRIKKTPGISLWGTPYCSGKHLIVSCNKL